MDDKSDGRTRPDRDRRLDIERLGRELVAGARDALLGRLPHRLDEIAPTMELPAASAAGTLSSASELPSGNRIRCHTTSARLCPNATTLS